MRQAGKTKTRIGDADPSYLIGHDLGGDVHEMPALGCRQLTSLLPPVEKHKLVDTLVGHNHIRSNDWQPAFIDILRSSVG